MDRKLTTNDTVRATARVSKLGKVNSLCPVRGMDSQFEANMNDDMRVRRVGIAGAEVTRDTVRLEGGRK